MNVEISSYQDLVARFKRVKKLGSGSYGEVYLVKDRKSLNEYALKVIPLSKIKDGHAYEFDIYDKLNGNPNIVHLHAKFQDSQNVYQLFEYCQGGDLGNYIKKKGVLCADEAILVFKQIVEAVNFIHSLGIAHLDLKPENVLITRFPEVKISDFGLSHSFRPGEKISEFCGTMHFSAPECLCNINYDAPKADIWSLGVILYFLYMGKTPWTSNDSNII